MKKLSRPQLTKQLGCQMLQPPRTHSANSLLYCTIPHLLYILLHDACFIIEERFVYGMINTIFLGLPYYLLRYSSRRVIVNTVYIPKSLFIFFVHFSFYPRPLNAQSSVMWSVEREYRGRHLTRKE